MRCTSFLDRMDGKDAAARIKTLACPRVPDGEGSAQALSIATFKALSTPEGGSGRNPQAVFNDISPTSSASHGGRRAKCSAQQSAQRHQEEHTRARARVPEHPRALTVTSTPSCPVGPTNSRRVGQPAPDRSGPARAWKGSVVEKRLGQAAPVQEVTHRPHDVADQWSGAHGALEEGHLEMSPAEARRPIRGATGATHPHTRIAQTKKTKANIESKGKSSRAKLDDITQGALCRNKERNARNIRTQPPKNLI